MKLNYGIYPARGILRGASRGFSLIELMITVVIIGILASIAYPSYQEQVRKSRRADGKSMLLETAQRLERCYTRFASYDNGGCDVGNGDSVNSLEGYYVISVSSDATSFTLDAAPQGEQANDAKCGTLRYTNLNVQGSLGADSDANECW